jgi:prepilin-type N-terminal cleavage/methylation domain-containing protein
MNNKIKKSHGFTLIELLVVVAIIGILASVIIVSISSVKSRGRDAKRVRDIQEINTAINLYILANGNPPNLGSVSCTNLSNYDASCFASTTVGIDNWNTFALQLEPFLKKMPTDPCPSCIAKEDLILNAYAASSVSEYIYEAPAAVNAYLESIGKSSATSGTNEQPYSIYVNNLEGKRKPFGFGLSIQGFTKQQNTKCPYLNKEQCSLWTACNKGDKESCVKLKPFTCPYQDDKKKCSLWEACNAGDEKSCSQINNQCNGPICAVSL